MERTRGVNRRAISLALRRFDKAQTDRCEVAACRLCPIQDVIEVCEPGFVKVVVPTTKRSAECSFGAKRAVITHREISRTVIQLAHCRGVIDVKAPERRDIGL